MCLRQRARGSWWNKRWIEETVDATLDRLGPDHLPGFYRRIMSKGLEIKGFAGIFAGQKALQDIAGWMKEGKIAFPGIHRRGHRSRAGGLGQRVCGP